jgi:phosphoribosyl-AMP cyclohydrolase
LYGVCKRIRYYCYRCKNIPQTNHSLGSRYVAQAELPDFQLGGGLLPAIAQDARTGQVLMLAWMNREALDETLASGRAVYYSRSRQRLWRKGEESGHVQKVVEVSIDCDADAILLRVEQQGAACHEGFASCFFRRLNPDGSTTVTLERLVDPEAVYGQSGKTP